jgi:hypothetical protein
MILESVFAALVFLHTMPVVGYILYMRHVALDRPWKISTDSQYTDTDLIHLHDYHDLTAPFVTCLLVIVSMAVLFRYALLLFLSPLLLISRVRELIVTHLANSVIMLLAVLTELSGSENVTWRKIEEIREHHELQPAQTVSFESRSPIASDR